MSEIGSRPKPQERSRWWRWRTRLQVLGAIILLLFARPANMMLAVALPFLLAGLLLRLWASGYLVKDSHLCRSGPYAYVQHPLYISNILVGLGLYVFCNNPLFTLITALPLVWIYSHTVQGEEEYLHDVYDAEHDEYQKQVPRFLPRLSPAPSASPDQFSWRRVLLNNRLLRFLIPVILLLVLLEVKLLIMGHYGVDYPVTYGLWPW